MKVGILVRSNDPRPATNIVNSRMTLRGFGLK